MAANRLCPRPPPSLAWASAFHMACRAWRGCLKCAVGEVDRELMSCTPRQVDGNTTCSANCVDLVQFCWLGGSNLQTTGSEKDVALFALGNQFKKENFCNNGISKGLLELKCKRLRI
eukprot:1157087-Pelagomonas_calceolata.AAC.11